MTLFRGYNAMLVALVVCFTSIPCFGDNNKFQTKSHLFEYSIESLRQIEEMSGSISNLADAKKVACRSLPPGEAEDCLLRLDVIKNSMSLVKLEAKIAIDAFGYVKGAHLTTTNDANAIQLGASNYQPLSGDTRVYFAEQAALIEFEVAKVDNALSLMLPAISLAEAAALHPTLSEVFNLVIILDIAYSNAFIASTFAIDHARGESGMIAALSLVNFKVIKQDGAFDSARNGYDQFADTKIHVGFDTQRFNLTLDDEVAADFDGGRYYRGFAMGYEIPWGTVVSSDLRARRGLFGSLIARAGSKIYAAPGYEKTPAYITLSDRRDAIFVNNIGVAMHLRPDDTHGEEINFIAEGDPICAGQQVMFPNRIDVTATPIDTEDTIQMGFTVFVTGGNRCSGSTSGSGPQFFEFHLSIDATKIAPTDHCWVWDPIHELYYNTCGGDPVFD